MGAAAAAVHRRNDGERRVIINTVGRSGGNQSG